MAYTFTPFTDGVDYNDASDVNALGAALNALDFLTLEAATELTVSGAGEITLTQACHKLQPAAGAADNIDTISGMDTGDVAVLYASDAGVDTLTFRHGVDNISCAGGADIDLSDGAVIIYYDGATVYVSGGGGADYASIAETDAGTEAAKAITPDGLAGSDYGKRSVILQPIADVTTHVVADGVQYFPTPEWMAGWNLVDVRTHDITAGTGVATLFSVMIHNLTQAADMLTTVCSIDPTETTSDTAATPVVINAAEDDITLGDLLRIDFDAINTVPGEGSIVELVFSMP